MGGVTLQQYDNLADRIKLARQVDHRPVLVVEGAGDEHLLGRLVPGVAIYQATGRRAVLAAARELAVLRFDRYACVVDRDFDDEVVRAGTAGLRLVVYPNADLESMAWHTQALSDVVAEYGSSSKVVAFGGVEAIRDRVARAVRPLAKLRRESFVRGWGLRFDAANLPAKVDGDTLEMRVAALCDALWRPDLGVTRRDLRDVATQEGRGPTCPVTGAELVRGRDALVILGVALRRRLGNVKQPALETADHLEHALRLAVRLEHVEESEWLGRLRGFLNED